jgi:hypothetical protein
MTGQKKYHIRQSKIIWTAVLIIILFGCNSDNINNFSIKNIFSSPDERIFDSYISYIKRISSPDFPLSSFQSNTDFFKKPVYSQKIQGDSNLQYFPATLWQIYSLNGESEWKQIAESYSGLLQEDNFIENLTDGELIQNAYLTPYLITGEKNYSSSLLSILAKYISNTDENCELKKGSPDLNRNIKIEKLLENQLLFFASKETGDPVYRELALNNSENIYHYQFQGNLSNDFFYGLANWDTIPGNIELTKLTTDDFYKLALCFYGFTILHNEKGNEKYHVSSEKLAKIFTDIFRDSNNKADKKQQKLIIEKIDLLSKAFVCLALYSHKCSYENNYKEVSISIFNNILDTIDNQSINQNDEHFSFRMYYYLFEYLKQLNN